MERKAYDPPEKLVWDTPENPERKEGRKPSKWEPVANELKAHPGKWACLGYDIPTGIVTVIRKGSVKCFAPEGSFECVVRNHTSRWQGDVYVRYVGTP